MNRWKLAAALAAAASAASPAPAQAPDALQAAAIREDVRILSSDAFQGRGPGEGGETATLAYLKAQFEAAGLAPGGSGGSSFQEVPLVRMDYRGRALEFSVAGQPMAMEPVREWSAGGSHGGKAELDDAPLIFAGFGIHAPELCWDD